MPIRNHFVNSIRLTVSTPCDYGLCTRFHEMRKILPMCSETVRINRLLTAPQTPDSRYFPYPVSNMPIVFYDCLFRHIVVFHTRCQRGEPLNQETAVDLSVRPTISRGDVNTLNPLNPPEAPITPAAPFSRDHQTADYDSIVFRHQIKARFRVLEYCVDALKHCFTGSFRANPHMQWLQLSVTASPHYFCSTCAGWLRRLLADWLWVIVQQQVLVATSARFFRRDFHQCTRLDPDSHRIGRNLVRHQTQTGV